MNGIRIQQTILADPDEILLIRDAGVQVWHQRQDSDGQQGDLLKCKLNGCLRFFFFPGKAGRGVQEQVCHCHRRLPVPPVREPVGSPICNDPHELFTGVSS